MTAAVRAYRMAVSDYYFRLTTESIRLFSNSVQKHSTFDEVVDHRAERALSLADHYEAEDLQGHVRVIPTDGDVEITLNISETSAEQIDSAVPALGTALGHPAHFAEVVSLILFDLIIERNATEIITKLGLTAAEGRQYRPYLKAKAAKIVPIR